MTASEISSAGHHAHFWRLAVRRKRVIGLAGGNPTLIFIGFGSSGVASWA
jgi:hypothetical protein